MVYDSTLFVSGSSFDLNVATQGGAIFASLVDVTVLDSTFSHNSAGMCYLPNFF